MDQGWRRGPRTQRKPSTLAQRTGSYLLLYADRKTWAELKNEPPRSERY
jgi:hypothetical protein